MMGDLIVNGSKFMILDCGFSDHAQVYLEQANSIL